jgi:hypothetical protein
MAIPETDNRIKLIDTIVDFDNEVGITGQEHDSFPSPGQNPRYDWMRSFLIGLLSLQSSHEEPTQKRTGTPWFDKEKQVIRIYDGASFVSLSQLLAARGVSLQSFFNLVNAKLEDHRPTYTFSGIVSRESDRIPIPPAIQSELDNPAMFVVLVFVNGLLVDPDTVSLSSACPNSIELVYPLEENDRFSVILKGLGGVGGDLELTS